MAANGEPAKKMTDDQRVAVGLKVGISNYVATASLAVLAGSLALYTYIAQNFSPSWLFYVLIGLGSLALVASIFLGGMGTDFSVAKAATGEWDNPDMWQFDWQAVLTIVALVFVIAATARGTTSDRAPDGAAKSREHVAGELRRLRAAVQADQALQTRVAELENEVRRLQAARRP